MIFKVWLLQFVVCFSYTFTKTYLNQKKKNKIINHETLNKTTIEAILNEIFTTDIEQNEHVIELFNEEYDL